MKVGCSQYLIKTQPYQSSGSQSLNPLAKGLLAIFSCVICEEKRGKCLKAVCTGLPGQTVRVSLSGLWESAVPSVTERAQVAGGARARSATEHKRAFPLLENAASTLSNRSSRRRERQPELAAKAV